MGDPGLGCYCGQHFGVKRWLVSRNPIRSGEPGAGSALMDRDVFDTLLGVKVLVEPWRRRYNRARRHIALTYQPLAP